MRNLFVSAVTIATVWGLVYWLRGLSKGMDEGSLLLVCAGVVAIFLIIARMIDVADAKRERLTEPDQR